MGNASCKSCECMTKGDKDHEYDDNAQKYVMENQQMKDLKKLKSPPMLYKSITHTPKQTQANTGTVIDETPEFQRVESNSQIEYDALDSGWRSTKMGGRSSKELAHIEMK